MVEVDIMVRSMGPISEADMVMMPPRMTFLIIRKACQNQLKSPFDIQQGRHDKRIASECKLSVSLTKKWIFNTFY